MKLLRETFDASYIKEDMDTGEKKYFIEGIFLQSNLQNRNGRVYPKEVLRKEVNRYRAQFIDKNRAMGELGHPDGPTINLDRVSHKIVGLWEDGDNFIGRAEILDTPFGKIVKNLMDAGVQLGVSSRGLGTMKKVNGVNEVQGDFYLATAADIVADPSAPSAFVNNIVENLEWELDDKGVYKPKEAANKALSEQIVLKSLEDFLSKL